MSDSLWPHGLQYTRLPCPSPNPGAYSSSCPLSQWCHPTFSPVVIPFSSRRQSFSASGSFQISSSQQVAKILEFQLQHQSFQWIFRNGFLQDGLVGSPCSPKDSQESSPTPQVKSINIMVENGRNSKTQIQWVFLFLVSVTLQGAEILWTAVLETQHWLSFSAC